MKLTSNVLEEITAGESTGIFTIEKIAIDSRKIKSTETFLALKGDFFDGHNFIEQAIESGCSSVIMEKSYYEYHKDRLSFFMKKNNFNNIILVEDSYSALLDIARHCRNNFKGTIIGITGSVGKTTLKEMTSFILSKQQTVTCNLGNLNNHIGMPLSLVNMNSKADIGIFELGMSASNEISFLSKILKPDIAVITEVSGVHIEFFESELEIAKAKIEILDGMNTLGTIFLNRDNQYYKFLYEKSKTIGLLKTYSTSLVGNTNANLYCKDIETVYFSADNFFINVNAVVFGSSINYKLKTIAKHNVLLSLFAMGLVKVLKLDTLQASEDIAHFEWLKDRGKIEELSILKNDKQVIKITMLNDSYNASPSSMCLSITSLSNIKVSDKILILGDMLELGEHSTKEHLKLQEYIINSEAKMLLTLGKYMMQMTEDILPKVGDKMLVKSFLNHELLLSFLENMLQDGDVLFLKGSLGSHVNLVANTLQNSIYKI